MAASHHKLCEVCGNPIVSDGRPSHIAKRRFCSISCRTAFQRGENNPHWRGGTVELTCKQCGDAFEVYPSKVSTLYCGKACADAASAARFRGERNSRWKGGAEASKRRYREKKRGEKERQEAATAAPSIVAAPVGKTKAPVTRVCKKCRLPGVKKGRSYHPECSPKPTGVLTPCLDCGVVRRVYPGPGRVCLRCIRCELKRKGGENNPNWRGGITPENKRIRASEAYRVWRDAVFGRDNYTCVWCGQRGGTLNADHIKPFSTHPSLRLDPSNGRTLCVACHKKTDTYLAKALKKRRRFVQRAFSFGDA